MPARRQLFPFVQNPEARRAVAWRYRRKASAASRHASRHQYGTVASYLQRAGTRSVSSYGSSDTRFDQLEASRQFRASIRFSSARRISRRRWVPRRHR
jgi:hypothetical protein